MKKLAFFDFDGTITQKDTMLELIKYSKGKAAFYFGITLLSPLLVAYKAGLIPNWRAKEILLGYFFKGTQEGEFERLCDSFTKEVIPRLIRPKALEKIKELKANGTRIILVTASAEQWVKGWCTGQEIEYLATRLETKENRITGKLLGLNCHGKEKVKRISQHLQLRDYQEIYAFGDTKGDQEMLKLARYAYYKPFSP